MAVTSAKVRNRWNAKHYDRINVTIPKGWAEKLKAFCADKNLTVNSAVTERMKIELAEFKKEGGE